MMNKETDQAACVAPNPVIILRSARFGKMGAKESGVTSIEYALIAMLIAMTILGSVTLLGGEVEEMWSNIADKVVNAISG